MCARGEEGNDPRVDRICNTHIEEERDCVRRRKTEIVLDRLIVRVRVRENTQRQCAVLIYGAVT